LLDSGLHVHVISHSWGTVVAYEGLRHLDEVSLSGRVENLFVVGSALSLGPVQANLFGRVTNGRRPTHVDRIINLDAGGDLVGGSIAGEFDVHTQYLDLEPTGCATIPFTNVALNMSCAHSSYFQPRNLRVNRDIFARGIETA
jgi:pimeloyl-ACP methyl ester carboxylesterase